MLNTNIHLLEKFLDKKIIKSKKLSDSFNINCVKITTEDKQNFVVKFYFIKTM